MNARVYIFILQNLYLFLADVEDPRYIYITFSNNLKRFSLKENVFCLMSATFPGYPPSGHLPAQS